MLYMVASQCPCHWSNIRASREGGLSDSGGWQCPAIAIQFRPSGPRTIIRHAAIVSQVTFSTVPTLLVLSVDVGDRLAVGSPSLPCHLFTHSPLDKQTQPPLILSTNETHCWASPRQRRQRSPQNSCISTSPSPPFGVRTLHTPDDVA